MTGIGKLTSLLHSVKHAPAFKCSSVNHSYKSAICLEKLHPQSSLKLTTPTKPATSQTPDFDGYIPLDQLEITYSRSSGPGGQNVNKVNTKVDVRFHPNSAKWLSDKVKTKLLEKFQSKLTKEGHLVFRSELTRHQQLNLADCLEKLRKCIRDSLQEKPEPSEETLDRIRRRMERANKERLAEKRFNGMIKAEKQILNNIQL
ncbi:peptidyl-tRNA hydrolase ICT1, mitochondrial [Dendroctonus ponderosae]